MLENLQPAPKIPQRAQPQPAVNFDGFEGEAITPGYAQEPESFDDYLRDAGLDPSNIEVIPPIRTSRWQQQKDGELVWLTSYRFTFRAKRSSIDLPLLMTELKKKARKPKLPGTTDKALVVLWSDLQVGKVDWRGGAQEAYERIEATRYRLIQEAKRGNYARIVFADLGDTIEGFDNKANENQKFSNDLSLMEQVDLATTFAWQTIRDLAQHVPTVTYASVGSNHCQWRINGKQVGKATDDWGVFIGRQLARLAAETNHDNIEFLEPQSYDESLALDVFDDSFHILGIVHGHQVNRPEALGDWWRKQSFGSQPVSAATILAHGHFHHLRVTELGSTQQGNSRFLIGAPTLDNGSAWFRNLSGEDSVPGLAIFELNRGIPFNGNVKKI